MNEKLEWTLSYSESWDGTESKPISASVPGCVQLDMAQAGNMPSIYRGNHEDEYRWMENRYWHYRTEAEILKNGETPALHLCGVEYECDILINGIPVLHHEGMITPVEINLTAFSGQKISIEVLVYPAPKRAGVSPKRGYGREPSASCKPPFSYGWDWCPRLVTLGITEGACLIYRPRLYFTDLQISYRLSEDRKAAKMTVCHSETDAGCVGWELSDDTGTVVMNGMAPAGSNTFEITVKNPELWWPRGYGKHSLYTLSCCLSETETGKTTHCVIRQIGFRQVKLVPNADVWKEPSSPVKTCSKPPMTAEINGRRIFIKGTNWVPPELCRSQLTRERLSGLVDRICDLNMNAIRIWGGGYFYPDYFYTLCDRAGILFWQEFPLACADYSDDEHYLSVLAQESAEMIRRLRTHPGLLLWCGGNELFNEWSGMTPQSKALRLLDRQTFELDPDTPYLMASPQYGVAHGSYDMICDDGRELLTNFCDGGYTAYVEFGCGSPSDSEYLKTFLTPEEYAHPLENPVWRARHASGSCDYERRWFDVSAIRKISGCSADWEKVFDAGNEIQAVMYACLFEEVRRQWPYASMVMNWCFNEPWPTAAGNGLINYPERPRRSYYGVREALRDTKFSLRFLRIAWRPGEILEGTVWLLNDSDNAPEPGEAAVSAVFDGRAQKLIIWKYGPTGYRSNQEGISFRVPVSRTMDNRFLLKIESAVHPEYNAEYRLFVNENAI